VTSDGDLFLWGLTKQTNAEVLLALRRETNSSVITSPTLILPGTKTVAVDDSVIVAITQKGALVDLSDDSRAWRSIADARTIYARYGVLIILDSDSYYVLHDPGHRPEPKVLAKGELPTSAAISKNAYAILSDGAVLYVFPDTGRPFVLPDVVSAAASSDRFVTLRSDARVYEVAGNGARRQIAGIGGLPVRVFGGGAHFGAITFEGECWTWGCGTRGQLGNGRFTVAFTPTKVLLKDGFCAVDAAAGEEHTLLAAVRDDAFVPTMPEKMKANEYMRMVRLAGALPGAFVAPELDVKF
jgi:hypothetical protein